MIPDVIYVLGEVGFVRGGRKAVMYNEKELEDMKMKINDEELNVKYGGVDKEDAEQRLYELLPILDYIENHPMVL